MIISPAALDALEAKAKAATLAKETPAGMFAPGVRDRVWNEFIAAASPDVVLALVATVRRLQGIVRDVANCDTVAYETWIESIRGPGRYCIVCGAVEPEGEGHDMSKAMPLELHKPLCPYRSAVEEQPK